MTSLHGAKPVFLVFNARVTYASMVIGESPETCLAVLAAGISSHLKRSRRLTVPVKHVTHVAIRAREHVAGVPTHGALEFIEYAIVLVQMTKLLGRERAVRGCI